MSLTTTPYASVVEADEYFDPLNHMYATEWWAAATGSSAKIRTTGSIAAGNLEIEVIDAGVNGNLYHMTVAESVYGPAINVGYDAYGPVLSILLAEGGTTAAAILALLNADSDFTDVMAASLVEAPGDVNMEEMADTYFTGGVDPNPERLGQKAPALALATRKINNLPFAGEKAVAGQANAFPRKYLRTDAYVGLLPTADAYYTETTVPDEVKMACCEEALAIMKYGNTPRYRMQKENVKSFAFGSQGLRETFTGRSNEGSMISGEAMNLLRKFMRRNYLMVA